MRKLAALGALAALALMPAAAQAHSRTTILRGSFELVGADGSYTSDHFGKAQLVDGRRNDLLSVHVRRLGARATYVFRLQSAAASACAAGAPGGTDVPGWRYRRGGVLKTNRHGVANSWARSHSFTAASNVTYFVGVYTATATGAPGQLVACAVLKGNRHGSKGKGGKSHGHSGDKHGASGRGNGNGDKDKPHGGRH